MTVEDEAIKRALFDLVERHPTEFERLVERHRCLLEEPMASDWLTAYDERRRDVLERDDESN